MRRIFSELLAFSLIFGFWTGNFFAQDELIQITVEITEVNNNKARDLGIKWIDEVQFGEVAWNTGGRSPEFLPEVPALFDSGDWARWTALSGTLKLLQEKGAAKILSKPKLLTRSGTPAEFKVGGEVPVVASGVSGGTIEWKDYGIILKIKPEVVAGKKIKASVETEVSRLDWANEVQGMPAITSRNASNNVIVNDGQMIAIAGLTETKKETSHKGIPLLSDLPLLKYLFGQEKVTETQNTILFFITPEIIK